MKKYWKSTAIIAVIVLSMGIFYINSALSAEQYPQFIIQKQSGDAKEIEGLVLEGFYQEPLSMNYVSTNLKITKDGSNYSNNSFLNQIIGEYPTMIEELQEEYRSFMRAKKPDVKLFFENSQFLAYADVKYKVNSIKSSDFTFDISVLDKKDDKVNSFMIKVPKSEEMDHVFVEDVQLVNNELNLITQNMLRSNNHYYNEKHIYTVDIAKQEISSHEPIVQFPKEEGGTNFSAELIEANPVQANEGLIFQITERKMIDEREPTRLEEVNQKIIFYNLATKEKEEVKMPGDLSFKENEISFLDGSVIYLTKVDDENLIVTPFTIDDNQVGQPFSIQLPVDKNQEQTPIIRVKDGKFYATVTGMNPKADASVIVADIKTGKTLYKGKLAIKDPAEEKGHFDLRIYEMFMK